MKYAPEKAVLEQELVELKVREEAHYAKVRKELEAGTRDPNDLSGDEDFYGEERRLQFLIERFPPILEVGDGVSDHGYSDVHPYEVIEVSKSGKKAKVRAMKADRDPEWKPVMHVGGFSAHCSNQHSQRWILSSDPNGSVMEISLRNLKCDPKYNHGLEKIQKWVPVGRKGEIGKTQISAGARKFYDYNF